MQKWEYLTLRVSDSYPPGNDGRPIHSVASNDVLIHQGNEELSVYDYQNKLGDEGWEMVSVDSYSSNHGHSNLYYFKRPKG